MATSSSWSAWAVFSNVEPPTSLHAATRGAAAASVRSGALLPSSRSFNGGDPTSSAGDHGPPATETFVCHFPFPLPALLVVYWIARPVAGKNAVPAGDADAVVNVYATVRREAAPRLIGSFRAKQGAAAITPVWTEDDHVFARGCPDRMGKLTVEFDGGDRATSDAAATPPQLVRTGTSKPESAVGGKAAGLPTPPHVVLKSPDAPAAPTSPSARQRDAKPLTVTAALMTGARRLATKKGTAAAPDAPAALAAPAESSAPASQAAPAVSSSPSAPEAHPAFVHAAAASPSEPAPALSAVDDAASADPVAGATHAAAVVPAAAVATEPEAAPESAQEVRHQPVRTQAQKRKVPDPAASVAKSNRTSGDAASAGPARPAGRWGHSAVWCAGKLYVFLGQGERTELLDDSLWTTEAVLPGAEPAWSIVPATGDSPGKRIGQVSACVGTRIYVSAGSKYKRWLADLHVFDTTTNVWSSIPAAGKAPYAAYHTLTPYKNELVVFGGVHDTACLNVLSVFNIEQGMWYRPPVTGDVPAPRSGHSATLVGELLVIFGGWDQPLVFNDVYTLDLVFMTFTKHETTGDQPSPRSWHGAAALPNGHIFIYGGFNGDVAMNDAFVLDPETWVWRKVSDALLPNGRTGHTVTLQPDGAGLFIFGGGDNEGRWFDGATSIPYAAL